MPVYNDILFRGAPFENHLSRLVIYHKRGVTPPSSDRALYSKGNQDQGSSLSSYSF